MIYNVYIKGKCEENVASCGLVIFTEKDEMIERHGAVFEDFISTKNIVISILPHKGQYQMELYALAWALTYCKDNSIINVYSNNSAVVKWINEWSVSADYQSVFDFCEWYGRGKTIKAYHIKKGWNLSMDIALEEALVYYNTKTKKQ